MLGAKAIEDKLQAGPNPSPSPNPSPNPNHIPNPHPHPHPHPHPGQEGVPDTIALLRRANLRFWMLTGDKYETAIQVGRAPSPSPSPSP